MATYKVTGPVYVNLRLYGQQDIGTLIEAPDGLAGKSLELVVAPRMGRPPKDRSAEAPAIPAASAATE